MRLFEQQLQLAKKKQGLLYAGLLLFFFITVILLAGIILVTRGTRIEVQPPDAADQSAVHLQSGMAFIVADTLYTISRHPVVSVSATGFQSSKKKLSDKDFGKIMSITLSPLPASVKISTDIANDKSSDKTAWLLNGEGAVMGPAFAGQLAAGDYQLTIAHPHYQDQILALSLARGEVFSSIIVMTPVTGEVTIRTAPGAASISINGFAMGVTPLTLPMQGGRHVVTVELDQYETIEDAIEINRDEPNVQRDYRLQPSKARVNVSLWPDDGKLTLDGIVLKETDDIKVIAGLDHHLEYSRTGYFPRSERFRIAADQVLNLDISLAKEMGQITLRSSPVAEVSLNGKDIGSTPLQLSLQAIKQTLIFSKPGFRSVTKDIVPSAESAKEFNVTLISEKLVRLKEAPRKYTNKVGIALRLFKPDGVFTMGAGRDEAGQRANEFIRKISLTKPFYAGLYEVTNAQYGQYKKQKNGDPGKPVVSVSWLDAAGFCNWLSQLEQFKPVYHIQNGQLQGIDKEADGYRLLTEAEWEWLARKAGKSKQSVFVWGDALTIPKNTANIADESARGKVEIFVPKYQDNYAEVAPVGSLQQEKSGLYDQAGNVSEWTHDSYSVIPPSAGEVLQDPLGVALGNAHVVKGASWRSGTLTALRASFREGVGERRGDLGFRIARYIYGGD